MSKLLGLPNRDRLEPKRGAYYPVVQQELSPAVFNILPGPLIAIHAKVAMVERLVTESSPTCFAAHEK